VVVGSLPGLIGMEQLVPATAVLPLLGVGWNIQVVAGSALLTGVFPRTSVPESRAARRWR
jgi:hypothetical protein